MTQELLRLLKMLMPLWGLSDNVLQDAISLLKPVLTTLR